MRPNGFWRSLAVASPLLGCAPRGGGYPELSSTVSDRVGMHVAWRSPESRDEGTVSPEVREALQHPITAAAAARIALLNNRDLRARFATLGIASSEVLGASLLPNPTAGFSYQFPVGANNSTRPALIDFDALIDVRAILLLPARRSAAQSAFDATRLAVAADAIDVAFGAEIEMYEFVASLQRIELSRTVLQATGAALEAARLLLQAGNVTAYELAQHEIEYQDARIALVEAENALRQRRERINVVLGLWGEWTEWQTDARLPDPPADDPPLDRLEARAIERSLPLAAARRRIDARRGDLGVARAAGAVPLLEAGVAVAQHEGLPFAGPAVRLSLPIFDQGQGGIGVRSAEVRGAESEFVAEAIRVRAAVRAAREQLVFARQRLTFYREVQLPARERLVAQALQQYNAMQLGVFQLLSARRDQIRVAAEFIGAIRDYWVARAQLERLLAGGSARPSSELTGRAPGPIEPRMDR